MSDWLHALDLKLKIIERDKLSFAGVHSKRQDYAKRRHSLIKEVFAAFPDLTLGELGLAFHQSKYRIGYALGRYRKVRK